MLDTDEATDHLRQAFDYYVQDEDAARAIAVASVTMTSIRGMQIMGPIIERGLELVDDDSVEAGRLLPGYGSYMGVGVGDYEGARSAFARALDIAKRENDLALELRTLTRAAAVDHANLQDRESAEKGLRAS